MARATYIYLLDDEEELLPFTVKHELEKFIGGYPECEVTFLSVHRYLDHGMRTVRERTPPISGEIVRSDDGQGWVVRFPRGEKEVR